MEDTGLIPPAQAVYRPTERPLRPTDEQILPKSRHQLGGARACFLQWAKFGLREGEWNGVATVCYMSRSQLTDEQKKTMRQAQLHARAGRQAFFAGQQG